MSDQPSLFDPRKAARTLDPVTSHEAAEAAEFVANDHHNKILTVLRIHRRAMAAEEIADRATQLDPVAVNRRMIELERGGLVERTDQRYRNRSGRSAMKWALLANARGETP